MNQQTARVMLVEDEVELAALVRDYLLAAGYQVEMHHSSNGVVEAVRQTPPDLLLLDLMLPGVDGLTLCRTVRSFSTLPIIMVTARVEEIDRLLGLDAGADDYVCKPFLPRELVARVRAVLRRTLGNGSGAPCGVPGLLLDEACARASVQGTPLDLTQVEFRLLRTLAAQPGRVYSRNQLLDAIHDEQRDVSDRAVDSHIKNLRRKLAPHFGTDELIRSVYGVGYKIE